MSRNLAARLEAAGPDRGGPSRPTGGPRRPSGGRSGQDDPDRAWKLLLALLCGLIVILGGVRIYQALTPAEKRLGAQLFDVKEPASGPLTFSIYDTPPLKEVGNCVAVRAGDEYFVVRAGSSTVNVFKTVTKEGELIRWDQKQSTFVYAKDPKRQFSVYGAPLDKTLQDELIPVLVSVINDTLQITR